MRITDTLLVFLAKMLQSKSKVLEHFGGLYTFGQPKIGDADFAKGFDTLIEHKIFHHVYNNGNASLTLGMTPYLRMTTLLRISFSLSRYCSTCPFLVAI